jgi:hypothetical protein
MNDLLGNLHRLRVHVNYELLDAFPTWHVSLMWYPLGFFHGRAEDPKTAFAAAWDAFAAEMLAQVPDWVKELEATRARLAAPARPKSVVRRKSAAPGFGRQRRGELAPVITPL